MGGKEREMEGMPPHLLNPARTTAQTESGMIKPLRQNLQLVLCVCTVLFRIIYCPSL